MVASLKLAFLLGFLGSMHCAVMCGPIVLSMQFNRKTGFRTVMDLIMYQLGRIVVYGFFGLLVGMLGSGLSLVTGQSYLSIGIGILMIGMAFLHFSANFSHRLGQLQARLIAPIIGLMDMTSRHPLFSLFAGALNGLIPCGMVYLAIATAANSNQPLQSAWFMVFFGLGTAPLLLIISMSKTYLRKYVNINTKRFIPWLSVAIGLLFILRAANLGIPFISPLIHSHVNSSTTICK